MSSVSSAGRFKMTVINSLDPDQTDLHCMLKLILEVNI